MKKCGCQPSLFASPFVALSTDASFLPPFNASKQLLLQSQVQLHHGSTRRLCNRAWRPRTLFKQCWWNRAGGNLTVDG